MGDFAIYEWNYSPGAFHRPHLERYRCKNSTVA